MKMWKWGEMKNKKATKATSRKKNDDVGNWTTEEMREKERDGKATKATKATRGLIKKCRGGGADKK